MDIEQLYELVERCGFDISIDSRQVRSGQVFWALRGSRTHGNMYAREALARGAALAVVDDPSLSGVDGCVVVDNTLGALHQVARLHRERLSAAAVVGIAGACGKTTTKELIACVLGGHLRVHATWGNYNSVVGLPLVLLKAPLDAQVVVLEMGSSSPGEIATLCDIAQPTHAIITSLGREHLEGFGSLERAIEEELTLYRWVGERGKTVFVNVDIPELESSSQGLERITYSMKRAEADVYGQVRSVFPRVELTVQSGRWLFGLLDVRAGVYGRHNAVNVLCAVCVALYFGVSAERITVLLEGFSAPWLRSQVVEWRGATVLLDAYNANPESMRAALETLFENGQRPMGVVLGDMLELGSYAFEAHREVVQLVEEANPELAVFVGEHFFRVRRDKAGWYFVDGVEEARSILSSINVKGWTILVKGSRKLQLERVVFD